MFEGAPPRFDHRVRLGYFDLGEDAVEAFGKEGGVDGGVDVLYARVGHDLDRGPRPGAVDVLAALDENATGDGWIEARSDGPGEDLAREILDYYVDVRLGAVDQLEDRDVDVRNLVRATSANTDGGLGRVDAKARAAPTWVANESGPRACEDLADALGVKAQGAQRYVPVLGSEHHVFDGGDLYGRELAGHGAWTGRAIVETAEDGAMSPSVVAGPRHPEDAQDQDKGESGLGAGDRAQDAGLGYALGKALTDETKAGGPQEREQKARSQPRYALACPASRR